MEKPIRFGVSLPKDLLVKFDKLIREKNYPNRSKAIGDLIRQELVKKEWFTGKEVAGAITIIYDHHKGELLDKLTDIQHRFKKIIISTQHIHLDEDNCLEIIAARGKPEEIKKLADTLRAIKGVKHGALSMSSTGKEIE
ncbi:MAG: nickel-responsive transcriptional regulator NikR [Candidatus Omnitrophica bacterium]|nr:nickel-responsive transcriptional regulator NikR [Candidatus Omnitrophota bacterium]MCM8798357.1 nickel-responsive transcriptional regulator NikR [Candidatus Omnitrophota bacterium]